MALLEPSKNLALAWALESNCSVLAAFLARSQRSSKQVAGQALCEDLFVLSDLSLALLQVKIDPDLAMRKCALRDSVFVARGCDHGSVAT